MSAVIRFEHSAITVDCSLMPLSKPNQMNCLTCQTNNPSGVKFCVECGTELSSVQTPSPVREKPVTTDQKANAPILYCASCGHPGSPTAAFCQACGKQMVPSTVMVSDVTLPSGLTQTVSVAAKKHPIPESTQSVELPQGRPFSQPEQSSNLPEIAFAVLALLLGGVLFAIAAWNHFRSVGLFLISITMTGISFVYLFKRFMKRTKL